MFYFKENYFINILFFKERIENHKLWNKILSLKEEKKTANNAIYTHKIIV
jgi:hypothetical protein